MSESPLARKPKGRSPAYPAINLETAIQRARQLHDRVRTHTTPVTTIATYWNYKSLNGPAAQTLAALKKYGLLDEEGAKEDRTAKLSDQAVIILQHPDPAARTAAIQQAALHPAIHRELWEKYREDLPPDDNLRWELTRNLRFTETGANEFIPVYRATIAFAQLGDADRTSEPEPTLDTQEVEEDRDDDEDAQPEHPSTKQRRQPGEKAKSYAIPLIDNGAVVVEGQFPLTERDWNQFMAVLTAMKPGLVAVSPDEDSQGASG